MSEARFQPVNLSDAEQAFVDLANDRIVECLRENQRMAFDRGIRQEAAIVMVEQNAFWGVIMFANVLRKVTGMDDDAALERSLAHMQRLVRGDKGGDTQAGMTLQ